VLNLLRSIKLLENQAFKINVRKNIPHGSGLGGGSSNAADLLNYFNSKMKLKLSKNKIKKLAGQIGFDVPVNLEKRNTFLTGKKGEILRLNQKFKLNLLIVYPNLICLTKKIYERNRKINLSKAQSIFYIKNNKKLINLLKNENNDLEKTVIKIYPKVKKIIDCIKSQKGCYFSRITGSGSACIGIFSNMKNAIYAQKLIKLKYPKYWCAVSKTI
jgi:4-diphosphocytidyl-2-C-methyl-D-erythritol kinase